MEGIGTCIKQAGRRRNDKKMLNSKRLFADDTNYGLQQD
jgi:hypothetical protein